MPSTPQEIKGSWDKGYALDVYTISSTYLGEDPFGEARFANVYSTLGKHINELKYQGKHDRAYTLADAASTFITQYKPFAKIDIILPVPPTKQRTFQPVFALAKCLAKKINTHYNSTVLCKVSTEEAKNRGDSEVKIIASTKAKRKINVLLVDDVYMSGKTLDACVAALRKDTNIDKIFVLVMAKTRTERG